MLKSTVICWLKDLSVILTPSVYDMNQNILKKGLLPKFQMIPILWNQLKVFKLCMIICIGIALLTTVLDYFSSMRIYGKIALFHTEIISAHFLSGDMLVGGELQIDAKNSDFDIFEDTLYMKSGVCLYTVQLVNFGLCEI